MNKNLLKKIVSSLLVIAVLALCLNAYSEPEFTITQPIDTPSNKSDNIKSSETSGPIHISSNQGWIDLKNAGKCTGEGTISEPYVIKDLEIDAGYSANCIFIENTDVYFIIKNCSLLYSAGGYNAGIKLDNVENGIMRSNNCSFGNGYGIYVWDSRYNVFYNNNASYNGRGGITLTADSLYNNISENIASDNKYSGITFGGESSYNIINGNIANNNYKHGFYFYSADYCNITNNVANYNGKVSGQWQGFYFYGDCDYNTISGNEANYNDWSGIQVHPGLSYCNSHHNNIFGNVVKYNYWDGIYIYGRGGGVSEIDVFKNVVIGNEIGIHIRSSRNVEVYENAIYSSRNWNGRDYQSNNIFWDKNDIGNYWDDYTGNDNNGDGIGDTPYSVDGDGDAKDYYPIWSNIPQISVIDPKSNDLFGVNSPDFNVEVVGAIVDEKWYTLGDNTTRHYFTSDGKIDQEGWNWCESGPISINFFANNSLGTVGSDVVTVRKYTITPKLIISSPTSNELFGIYPPTFNIEINESNLESMWYSLDGGLNNITFSGNETFDLTEWSKLKNGTHLITFFAKDLVNNLGSTSINIRVDTSEPMLKVIYPLAQKVFKNSPEFTIEINDTKFHKSWYTLNLNPTKHFFIQNETIDPLAWSILLDGPVTITFYANNTIGNINFTSISIFKDTSAPEITIITPYSNQIFNDTVPNFRVDLFDYCLNKTWYSINGSKNYDFAINQTFNPSGWSALVNGTFTIIFYANDTFGHESSALIIVKKDIEKPAIQINSPVTNKLYGNIAPEFDISINEGNLHSTWYRLVNLSDLTDYTLNTTFDYFVEFTVLQDIWNQMDNGSIILCFYANDTAGNIGFKQIVIRKDIIPPQIMIHDPNPDLTFKHAAPDFHISIIEGNLNMTWYTINGGATRYFLTESSGRINQTAWNKLKDGIIIITFWANDTMGNMKNKEITITKMVGSGDGGDDGDEEGLNMGIVVLVIIFASIGAGAAVIAVLMKKRIIDLSKRKRK